MDCVGSWTLRQTRSKQYKVRRKETGSERTCQSKREWKGEITHGRLSILPGLHLNSYSVEKMLRKGEAKVGYTFPDCIFVNRIGTICSYYNNLTGRVITPHWSYDRDFEICYLIASLSHRAESTVCVHQFKFIK